MRFEASTPSLAESTTFTDVKSRVLDFTFQDPAGIYGLMVYYTWKGNTKHGEIIWAESSVFALRKTQGVNGWTTAITNANPVNSKTKISLPTERVINIFLNRKHDRTYGERVDDRLEADTGELKRFERRSQDGGSNAGQLGAISWKWKKCRSRRWKRLNMSKGNMAKRISFPQWSTWHLSTPHLHRICAADQGNSSAKRL